MVLNTSPSLRALFPCECVCHLGDVIVPERLYCWRRRVLRVRHVWGVGEAVQEETCV